MTADPLDLLLANLVDEINMKINSKFYMQILKSLLNQNKEIIRTWLKRNVNLINQIART